MFFCEYCKIFKNNFFYSTPFRRATTGEGRGFPCRFYKSLKVPWFWKKRPDIANLWVKISIQNVVLRVSRRKNSKTFPFFSRFLTKCLSKCPDFPKTSSALKNFWLRACLWWLESQKETVFSIKGSASINVLSQLILHSVCQYDAQSVQHSQKQYFLAWISLLSEYIDISCLFIRRRYSFYLG